MRLTYCRIDGGNFGDDLNPWLWPQIAPGLCDDAPDEEFLGVGSILANTYPPGPRRIVFGSGAGYKRPPVIDAQWKIYCVRGPKTAAALKIDPQLAVTDSAALVATLPWSACTTRYAVSYMPHYLSAELGDWAGVCRLAGAHYIAPNGDVAAIIDEIRRSRLLVTEALHGAVVADALRIPWIPVRCYGHILRFKWEDWCQSLGMQYQPHRLPSLWQNPLRWTAWAKHAAKRALGYLPGGKEKWRFSPVRTHGPQRIERLAEKVQLLIAHGRPQLSAASTHDRVMNRLLEKLETLKCDRGIAREPTSQTAA